MVSLVIGMTRGFILSGVSQASLHALRHTGAELAFVASHGLVCPSWALLPNEAQDLWGLSRAWLMHRGMA